MIKLLSHSIHLIAVLFTRGDGFDILNKLFGRVIHLRQIPFFHIYSMNDMQCNIRLRKIAASFQVLR